MCFIYVCVIRSYVTPTATTQIIHRDSKNCDWSVWAVCYKFLMRAEIFESEDDMKQVKCSVASSFMVTHFWDLQVNRKE